MITKENFFEEVNTAALVQMPESLKKGYQFIDKATETGANWKAYEIGESTKKAIDLIIAKFNEHAASYETKNKTVREEPTTIVEKVEKKKEVTSPTTKKTTKKKFDVTVKDEDDFTFVERIPDEIRFIRRFLALHNKKKSKDDLLRFINALHRAIIERKIRKGSPYEKQINYIQEKLIARYNDMERPMVIEIQNRTYNEFKALIVQEKVMPSVQFIKRYILLNGKYGVKEKAKKLLEAMHKANEKGKISKRDRYASVLDSMHHNLTTYIKSKSQKVLSIQETELNGLNGFLECNCATMAGEDDVDGLEGIDEMQVSENIEGSNYDLAQPATGVMNSMDFKKMEFKTLGFTGKYKDLIGDPSPGFSAMVFGRPKMGKSYLCVDFAGYLASNFGKVLYVAKEEGLDLTLQTKLKANDIAHPNLDIADTIPEDLSSYSFVFLDSVNSLGLTTSDMETLKSHNPETSFIQIYQTTKAGAHRGDNESQHNVDIVIEVPEKGIAVQNGRFNQGGTINIFNDEGVKQND